MTNEQHDMSLFLLSQDLCLKVAEYTAGFIENKSISHNSQTSLKSKKSQTSSISKSHKSKRSNATGHHCQKTSHASSKIKNNKGKNQVTFNDDLSTIDSRQSSSIPASVSIHNPTKDFITRRKYRKNSSSSISSYESKVRESSKSHKHPIRNERRSSGFSKAKSFIDRHIHHQ